jgi:tyrosine decarboxylase/aspartate 1-decarboxylase
LETEELAGLLEERNWKISCSSYPKAIRVILMNHIKKEHLIELIGDLEEISKSI